MVAAPATAGPIRLLSLWWRRKRHTTLSEMAFDKVVDPAVGRMHHRHDEGEDRTEARVDAAGNGDGRRD